MRPVWLGGLIAGAFLFTFAPAAPAPARIVVDYPADGSLFPSHFPPPPFLFRDPAAVVWTIEVQFSGGAPPLRFTTRGERMKTGPVDARAVAETNAPPALTPHQAVAHVWRPESAAWEALQQGALPGPATVIITGYADAALHRPVSRGQLRLATSPDPVGAPVFYRDVPLMPAETEKGVIKPLAPNAIPLIAWRLRDLTQPNSRILMQGLHTCANCHSFSLDGKTMGMDVDGPQNDKGLYALTPVAPRMSIEQKNVVAWSTFRGKLGGRLRVGFMSQVSPDGQFVVTMINDPGYDETEYERRKNLREVALNYFVANFKDYRFLQVFYPTRGILAWYSRKTGVLQPLPGADDPRYVHTNAVWSPDGKYLVFARAAAQDPYAPGVPLPLKANDATETQVRYDLYRIPFNGGAGGRAELIAGASQNGMSNSFPKVSPDGRWIVYVQSRNGLLMRPDSKLYIVPAAGGAARALTANTPRMNSWHSFSPNGRWLVFSSKSWSPYTQLMLTHLDAEGNASPAVLVENTTAANRAVNLPEFVNIPTDGLLKIDAPVTEYYRLVDEASELGKKGQQQAAIARWREALALNPDEARAHNNLGVELSASGDAAGAMEHFRRAVELSPEYPMALNNLAEGLIRQRQLAEALPYLEKAVGLHPRYASAHSNLGSVLAQMNRLDEAIPHLRQAVETQPDLADAQNNLGVALMVARRPAEAAGALEQAAKLTGGKEPLILDLLGRAYFETGRTADAVRTARRALATATAQGNARLAQRLKTVVADYEAKLSPAQR